MTTFQKHDRIRVVDDSRRGLTRSPFPYAYGEIVTVESQNPRRGLVHLADDANPMGWVADRFELVEHAVNADRNGTPLYGGDIVRRVDTAPGVPNEGPVKPHQVVAPSEELQTVQFTARHVTADVDMWPRRDQVELVRHHWESPPPSKPTIVFQNDDAVRVLDTPANRKQKTLTVGEVLIVNMVVATSKAVDGFLVINGMGWDRERFELVEHSTGCSDKDGRTLYAGDVIRRHDADGFRGAPYEATVSATQTNRGAGIECLLTNGNGRVWAPSQFVTLVRHHWEPEVVVGVDPAASGKPFAVVGWVSDKGIRLYPAGCPPENPVLWTGEPIDIEAILRDIDERAMKPEAMRYWAPPVFSYNRDVDLPDGTVVVLVKAHETPELHRIAGTFVDAKTGQRWTDLQLSRHTYKIVHDPRKDRA